MEISFLPSRWMNMFSEDTSKQADLNILLSILLLSIMFWLGGNRLIIFLGHLPHFCLMEGIFGIECPFCGTTRAFCELANGNIDKAFGLNSMSLPITVFLLLQIPLRIYLVSRNTAFMRVRQLSRYCGNAIVLCMIVVWAIRIVTV